MAWGDDDGGDKKKGCFKCGEKIREIYVPKEEIDDSKLFESCAVICVNGMYVYLKSVPKERCYVPRCVCCA